MHAARRSPAKHSADQWPVEAQVLDCLARLCVVTDIAPHGDDLSPLERVTDAGGRLERAGRSTGARIKIEGQRPLTVGTERITALDPDNRVPDVLADFGTAGSCRGIERSDRPADAPT